MARSRTLFFGLALALGLAVEVAVLAWSEPAQARAAIRYVTTSGVDDGDCLDVEHPCRTVQYAVDASLESDVIKVAAGVYNDLHIRPALPGDPFPPPGGVVTQVVYVNHTVTILGGYGAADFAEPPDAEANPTALDAGGQGRVLYVVGEIHLRLEGLILTHGQVGNQLLYPGYGGGVYAVMAAVALSGCVLQDNGAIPLYQEEMGNLFPVQGGQGGGLYAQGGDLSIVHSRVEGNRAWYGAGLFLQGGTLTLVADEVRGNSSQAYSSWGTLGYGGGLYLAGTQATLVGSAVVDNRAWGSGGGLSLLDSRVTLDGDTLTDNTGVGSFMGYGTGAGGGLWATSSQITLTGTIVSDNDAHWAGGGLYLYQAEAVLIDSQVRDNSIVGGRFGLSGGGAGLWLEGGHASLSRTVVRSNSSEMTPCSAVCAAGSELRAENTLIADNGTAWSSQQGGAVHLDGSTATLVHVTLARNTDFEGTGVYVSAGSAIQMTNTVVVSQGVGIHVAAGGDAFMEATLWGAGAWANGTDWGGDGTIVTGTVNVWGEPEFIDAEGGNYHIGPASAALNRGLPVGVEEDIDGEPRPDWCFYDIGADELLTGEPCRRVRLPAVPRGSAGR